MPRKKSPGRISWNKSFYVLFEVTGFCWSGVWLHLDLSSLSLTMSATPEPAKYNSKNCNNPSAAGKASCARHLKAASDRMTRLREDRKAAAQKSKNPTSMTPQDPFQGNDASKTRLALQLISVNHDGTIPAKRKRPENDSSSEEEASLAGGKVSGDLSMGGSHRSTGC